MMHIGRRRRESSGGNAFHLRFVEHTAQREVHNTSFDTRVNNALLWSSCGRVQDRNTASPRETNRWTKRPFPFCWSSVRRRRSAEIIRSEGIGIIPRIKTEIPMVLAGLETNSGELKFNTSLGEVIEVVAVEPVHGRAQPMMEKRTVFERFGLECNHRISF